MRPQSKPPLSATLNHGHPLAQGMISCFLVNELGGALHDLVTGNVLPIVGSGAFSNARFGHGLNCNGNDSGAYAAAWDQLKEVGRQFTILWRGVIAASPAAFGALCNVTYTNADTSPYLVYGLQINSGSDGYFLAWNDIGSGCSFSANTGTAFDGTERQVVGVVRATGFGGANALYEGANAAVLGTNTQNCGPSFTANSKIGIGVYQVAQGRDSKSICRHAYIWKRALTPSEIEWLFYEPYAFVTTEIPRKFYKFTSAPLTSTSSENANTLTDAVSLANTAAAGYGVTPSDRLNILDNLNLLGPPPDYIATFGDALANIQDSVRPTLRVLKAFSDSINNFTDAFSKVTGIPISAFDSQQFNWSDAVSTLFLGVFPVTKSDSLNNYADAHSKVVGNVKISVTAADTINLLADALRLWDVLRIRAGDNYVLADSLTRKLVHLLAIAELLTAKLDSALIERANKPSFSDTLNITDAVTVRLASQLRLSVED